jgi:hypothetical protein
MARNNEAALAARQRKQKIIVAVGGVIFLALAAIQGPKLWKQLNPPPANTAASATSTSSGTSAPATGVAGASAPRVTAASLAATAPKSATTQLAGVIIVREQPAQPGEGQLGSFSRFESKDPFVQQVSPDALPTPAELTRAATGNPTPTAPKPTAGTTTGTTVGPGGVVTVGTGTAAPLPAATMAMLRINGKLQTVELKKRFPSSDKAFVLRSLRPGSATFGVAGGSFAGGVGTLTVRLGRSVTLVNTATGVRYVIKLVYVGADAAQVTGFSAK